MRVAFCTLGCDKNTVDSEYLAGLFKKAGHHVVEDPLFDDNFDAVLINTCGFIDTARKESINAILEWIEENKRRSQKGKPSFRIYVVGCLAQKYCAALMESLPEVDGFAGVGKWHDIVRMVLSKEKAGRKSTVISTAVSKKPSVKIKQPMPRKKLDPFPYSYLKISDGCSHRCSFCAIPHIKGPYNSVPRKILLKEAEVLVRNGVREINLVAQDINLYGRDIYKNYGLYELVRDITQLPGKFWVRILYFFPRILPKKLLTLFQNESKLCSYIDMPLQHASPSVLKRMGRSPDITPVMEMLSRYRREIPELSIRTTFIVGFPGETRADFNRLVSLVKNFRFDRMGAFLYSPEEGTRAERLDLPVPSRTAQSRLERLMLAQADISMEKNKSFIGKTCEVLIDYVLPEQNLYLGRTMRDAPEVDGVIYVTSPQKLEPGEFIKVHITKATVYDLYGDKVEKHS